ncbi:MAG: ATP-binding protein [Bacteroidales bacterium]|nr:ATP-binding protein [Bacteroidales bacterium]
MEIAVISGKGGTGKSSISASFASLYQNTMLVDCDVDAANLHLLFNPQIETQDVFIGAESAVIDYDICTNCGLCSRYCRFDAISFVEMKVTINEVFCDGCRLCANICPVQAISMVESKNSRLYTASYRYGKMVYGILGPGEENSGKLVNLVRDKAKNIAEQNNIETIIIDGPPGIGCPVISTITGVDHVVIVTEPTISGIHDLGRTLQMTTQFNLKSWVIINKFDINSENSFNIEKICIEKDIEILAKIPFNSDVVNAMVNCKTIPEFLPNSDIHKQIKIAFDKVLNYE